jgi:hypothetical protein
MIMMFRWKTPFMRLYSEKATRLSYYSIVISKDVSGLIKTIAELIRASIE